MMSPTLETDSVVVRESAVLKDQFGVFTKKKFNKGETIFSVKGPVMNNPTRILILFRY